MTSNTYHLFWRVYVRNMRSGPEAVKARVKRVLARAGIKALQNQYVTTVVLPADFKRHVASVKLSDNAFMRLYEQGYLKLIHTEEAGLPPEQIVKKAIPHLLHVQRHFAKAA